MTDNEPRNTRARARWWEVAGILIAFLLFLFTAWQGIAAQRATAKQLALFRTQVESSRPILAPVAGSVLYDESTMELRFKLQNVGTAAALSGLVVANPYSEHSDDIDGDPRYPSCGPEGYALHGHDAVETLPPVSPNETITVAFYSPPIEVATLETLCVAAGYTDAVGTQWLTDWVWNRKTWLYYRDDGSTFERTLWQPTQLRSFEEPDPEWHRRRDGASYPIPEQTDPGTTKGSG